MTDNPRILLHYEPKNSELNDIVDKRELEVRIVERDGYARIETTYMQRVGTKGLFRRVSTVAPIPMELFRKLKDVM